MKLEIENGRFVGTAEWRQPGVVILDIPDPAERRWFEAYFASEDSYLDGSVECDNLSATRNDSSEQAFAHAAFRLAAYAYKVRAGEGMRTPEPERAT